MTGNDLFEAIDGVDQSLLDAVMTPPATRKQRSAALMTAAAAAVAVCCVFAFLRGRSFRNAAHYLSTDSGTPPSSVTTAATTADPFAGLQTSEQPSGSGPVLSDLSTSGRAGSSAALSAEKPLTTVAQTEPGGDFPAAVSDETEIPATAVTTNEPPATASSDLSGDFPAGVEDPSQTPAAYNLLSELRSRILHSLLPGGMPQLGQLQSATDDETFLRNASELLENLFRSGSAIGAVDGGSFLSSRKITSEERSFTAVAVLDQAAIPGSEGFLYFPEQWSAVGTVTSVGDALNGALIGAQIMDSGLGWYFASADGVVAAMIAL